ASRHATYGLSMRANYELVSMLGHGLADNMQNSRTAPQRMVAPGVADLADRLSDSLDTRVRVDLGRRKGKITVEFASVDDLERIVGLIAPQLSSRTQSNEP